jgi:hypothetical protein
LAIAVTAIMAGVLRHVRNVTDATVPGRWSANLPLVIAALVGLMAALYTVDRASGSMGNIISALRKQA